MLAVQSVKQFVHQDGVEVSAGERPVWDVDRVIVWVVTAADEVGRLSEVGEVGRQLVCPVCGVAERLVEAGGGFRVLVHEGLEFCVWNKTGLEVRY